MPLRPWPIRWWLATLTIAIALPLLILLTWLFSLELRRERSEARDTALRIARATAARLEALHSDSLELLERMAMRPLIRNPDPDRCDSLFAIVDFFPQYANLLLLDPTGNVVCSASPQPEDAAISRAAEQWIVSDFRAGRLVPRRPVLRPFEGRWVSALLVPVTAEAGREAGYLTLIQLPQLFQPDALPPHTVLTIVDRNGIVLARSNDPERWLGRNARGTEVMESVLRQDEGRTEAKGLDGVQRQYGFTRMVTLGWRIYVGVPSAGLMQPVRQIFFRGLSGGALIVLLVTLAALRLSRMITRPINALAHAAQSATTEGYGASAPVGGPLEIAMLGAAFNEMVKTRSEAEKRVIDSERNLKALSDRLLVVQEQERARIAREIHDDLGQSLTALKMDVGGLLKTSQLSESAGPVIGRIRRTLDNTVSAVQRISAELRPATLDDLGLAAALESEARLFEERSGIECDLSLPEEAAIDGDLASAIYRIVQEALTNVARHADATRVEIRLRSRPDELLLEIRDDGRGITPSEIDDRDSLGLIGIRERAAIIGGAVRFEGIAGRGTIVSVRIPHKSPSRSLA